MTVTKTVERLGKGNQAHLFKVLSQYIKDNGYAPSVEELGKLAGFSFNTTYSLLEVLEATGRITRKKGAFRSIRIVRGSRRRRAA